MVLEIQNLVAGYGESLILRGVNLHVKEGEIVTIIGPNGAGKSTILKSIFGHATVHEGVIRYRGEDILHSTPRSLLDRRLCYVPQGRVVFPSMTVHENLELGAYVLKDKKRIAEEIEKVYERFPRLRERAEQKAKTLSGGEQQMIVIGRALMVDPILLLLDEPSLGLAPHVMEEVFEKIQEIRGLGVSVLMVEQNANMALEISDRAYVLELGVNRYEGTGKELLSDPRVGELYLGKGATQ